MDGHPVCLAVSHAGKQLAVGKADGKVELNDLPDVDFDDFLVRATSPIRDVCFSASDKWAAVVSDDLEVLLVEVAAREVTQLKGAHEGAGRSVCFDPKEEFLVSLGADGQACVWDLATKACVWSKRVLERGASADPHLVVARAAWRPDGGVLALPGSRQPLLVERGSWQALPSAPAAALAHANDTSVLAWSPDGKVLASAGLDKRVLLWAAAALAQGGALQATQVYTGPAGDDAGPGLGLCVRNLAWTKDRALALLAADGSFALQAVPAAAAVATTATAAAAPEADGKKALGAQEEEKEKAGAEGASDEERYIGCLKGNDWGGIHELYLTFQHPAIPSDPIQTTQHDQQEEAEAEEEGQGRGGQPPGRRGLRGHQGGGRGQGQGGGGWRGHAGGAPAGGGRGGRDDGGGQPQQQQGGAHGGGAGHAGAYVGTDVAPGGQPDLVLCHDAPDD